MFTREECERVHSLDSNVHALDKVQEIPAATLYMCDRMLRLGPMKARLCVCVCMCTNQMGKLAWTWSLELEYKLAYLKAVGLQSNSF